MDALTRRWLMADIEEFRVAFVVANEGVERVELSEPWKAVVNAGGVPHLLAPEAKDVQTFDHLDKSKRYNIDDALGDCDPRQYDALMLPGGVVNADHLREVSEAVDFARVMVQSAKPVAVICHGPWTLIEADAVRGRTITSWPGLRTDLRNAGANWVDEEVRVDTSGPAPIVSSRKPDDLPAFCDAMIETFRSAATAHGRQLKSA
jgi:protease I